MYYYQFETVLWPIVLVGDEQGLSALHMITGEGKREFTYDPKWQENSEMFRDAERQILEFLAGKRKQFDLLLNPQGTDFQKEVWGELMKIDYGETASYGEVAKNIGRPKASRAVGAANGKNPIPLIIPCHRVIGASGKLTGYALGLKAKEFLLQLEGR